MQRTLRNRLKRRIAALISCTMAGAIAPGAFAPGAFADDDAPVPSPLATLKADIEVIGSKENIITLPGSGYYLDTDEIRTQNYDDVNQALRKVPGVYLRGEDGFGLFPNISLRGTDTTRSAKVTMMEDGVLMAPAAYSAPEAYFSPTTGRMSGIEILKGSSQILYGPHITGGVINYLSTPIPETPTGYIKATYGSDNDIRLHANYGTTIETESHGRIGFVGELWYRGNDGFKSIDSAPDFNGGDTGFTNVEPMFKIFWEPPTSTYQRFEFKYGYTSREADETYLGLSEADFAADHERRYAASRFDNFDSYQHRTHLRHYIELTQEVDVTTTLYYTRFHRNWYKLNDLRNIDTDGDGTGDGVNQSLAAAIAGAGGDVGLDVLRGDRAGTLRVRANNRDYYAYGVSIDPRIQFQTGEIEHELRFGIRLHRDYVERFQHDDLFVQDTNGAIISSTPGIPGSQDNRREESLALAGYVQDEIKLGKLTLTPGIRVEQIWQDTKNRNAGTSGDADYAVAGGGVGFNFKHDEQWTFFGGIHRGFSTPSPSGAVAGLREESSIAFEGGVRFTSPKRAFIVEAVAFYSYFDDLIVVSNVGGSGSGEDENVGRVDSFGIEFLAQYDPGIAFDWGFSMPNFFSFTWTNAELADDSDSTDPESIFAGGEKGNKVPYVPEYLATIGTGIDFKKKWGIFITGSFTGKSFSSALNNDDFLNANGDPDARFGELDPHFVVDISGYYQLNEQAKIVAGVHNLFDEVYVASRHPHGARPGAPQFLYVGMEIKF